MDGLSDHGFDSPEAFEIDDGNDLPGDVGKAVSSSRKHLRSPAQFGRAVNTEKSLDRLSAFSGFKIALRQNLTAPADGQ